MKHLFSFFIFSFIIIITASSQTSDDIIDNYFENTGGYDSWSNLKGVRIMAKVNQQGMEIPVEIVFLSDGRQYTKISFQGMSIMQDVFDGNTLWGTNFQSMEAEKADAEATERQKLESNDFPDPLFDYKKKGYQVEMLGKETIDGTETFKLKLVREPIKVDGEEVENVSYFYFDTESFVPIVQESEVKQGPQKGAISQLKLSDYQEVDGLYFPFSMDQGIKGVGSQAITIESIELNPEVPDSEFAFPETK